jgi:hypothetical protein
MVSDQICQSVENLILIFPHNRGQTLAGQSQFVTEGNPDSFTPIVETEYSHLPFLKGHQVFSVQAKSKSISN